MVPEAMGVVWALIRDIAQENLTAKTSDVLPMRFPHNVPRITAHIVVTVVVRRVLTVSRHPAQRPRCKMGDEHLFVPRPDDTFPRAQRLLPPALASASAVQVSHHAVIKRVHHRTYLRHLDFTKSADDSTADSVFGIHKIKMKELCPSTSEVFRAMFT